MSLLGSDFAGRGIVDEITIGSNDLDMTVDPRNATVALGPAKALEIIEGTGVLAYIDDPTGTTRTLGGTVALDVGDRFEPISVRKILGTNNATPSSAMTLRVRW